MEDRTRPYIRDVNDHVMQVLEGLDLARERLSGVLESHVSAINLKTNEIMRVLTVISSIFIPLTFVVGVYGMNFDNMPELHWRYGYHAIMAAQVGLAVALLWWFRRRGWL
jgi:magnesium transporter